MNKSTREFVFKLFIFLQHVFEDDVNCQKHVFNKNK